MKQHAGHTVVGAGVATAAAVLLAVSVAAAQEPGALFPQPFVVEHAVVQTDADGSVFETEPVQDTYAGSRIVSERADGSRLIIDFARREITEVRPDVGRYTVIDFDRMADLLRELDALEQGTPTTNPKAAGFDAPPQLRVQEVQDASAAKSSTSPELRRYRVLHQRVEPGDEVAVLDAWFDRSLRFGDRALAALEDLEVNVLGAARPSAVSPRALAAARAAAEGAVAMRTVRPLAPAEPSAGSVEDAALRVERVDAVPAELFTVPDGFERGPHPLELMVAHARSEAELNRRMGGSEAP
jgi:hypothetical protein